VADIPATHLTIVEIGGGQNKIRIYLLNVHTRHLPRVLLNDFEKMTSELSIVLIIINEIILYKIIKINIIIIINLSSK